jgi:hypothetical protein
MRTMRNSCRGLGMQRRPNSTPHMLPFSRPVQSAYHLRPICKASLYKRKVTTASLVHKLSPCSAQCECACLIVIDATQKLAV